MRTITLCPLNPLFVAALLWQIQPPLSGTQQRLVAQQHDTIPSIVLHPVLNVHFVCLEHHAGQLRVLGDALAVDCVALALAGGPDHRWPVFYRGDGVTNADWYGWQAAVLAPFDGVVDSVHINPTTNRPGQLGEARASIVVFRRADSVRVLYAHLRDISVAIGDSVRAGEPVARVGNNGPAWFPHFHAGAWKRDRPLQIRFDPVESARLGWAH